jgi:hypothetical protein
VVIEADKPKPLKPPREDDLGRFSVFFRVFSMFFFFFQHGEDRIIWFIFFLSYLSFLRISRSYSHWSAVCPSASCAYVRISLWYSWSTKGCFGVCVAYAVLLTQTLNTMQTLYILVALRYQATKTVQTAYAN